VSDARRAKLEREFQRIPGSTRSLVPDTGTLYARFGAPHEPSGSVPVARPAVL